MCGCGGQKKSNVSILVNTRKKLMNDVSEQNSKAGQDLF
jgi:hypothetical protein